MAIRRYFAGGNTAEGFFGCFEDVPPKRVSRAYYLKGGPGVGKSTLMRRIGEEAEKRGLEVEYFHCASDPDSLDAVTLPQVGATLMDGTAPHVRDPIYPGARDTLLPLGDCLDEAALRPHAREIADIQAAIADRYRRAYRYLGAARALWLASACGALNEAKAERLAARWREALPRGEGEGRVRALFLSAYTPEGPRTLDDPACVTRFLLNCPDGLRATPALRSVAASAASRGLDAVLLRDPLCPRELVGVAIPSRGLCYRAEALADGDGERAEAGEAFDLVPRAENEQGYDRNARELMLTRAVEQLRAAKGLHDELEAHYARAMDYARWEELYARTAGEVFG